MNADLETQIIELNNNPAFCALREKFAQDTIFDILGATNRELVNSRFFAWLLDPNGFHNLGTKGVEKLLECIYIKCKQAKDNRDKGKVSLLKKFIYGEFEIKGVSTGCEASNKDKTRLDILIEIEYLDKINNSPKELNKYTIIIENKYNATERKKQTENYEKQFDEKNIDYIGIYLTLNGEHSKSNFIDISYEELFKCVIYPLEQLSRTTNSKANMFINDYLSAQHISLEIPQDINLKLNKILLAESPNDTPCGLFVKFVKDNKALLQEWMKENESELAKKTNLKKRITRIMGLRNSDESVGMCIKRMINETMKNLKSDDDIKQFIEDINKEKLCSYIAFKKERNKRRYYANTADKIFTDINSEILKDYYFTNHWFEKDIEKMRKWLDEYRPSK